MQLGNYAILQELSSKSFLSRDASGRKIVLKALPADCLLEGQLNPNIADRLRRVREIAMTDVANLRGVERLNDGPFLIWDFVEAVPLLQHAATLDDDGVRRLCDELMRTVDRFHATGLIHGALHPGNILVDSNGRIRLIDVSPLLFLDPKRDQEAVEKLCRELDANVNEMPAAAPVPRSRIRRRILLGAVVVAIAGIGVSAAVLRLVHRTQSAPLTPPRLVK
jgi:serine/threonine protein kinase